MILFPFFYGVTSFSSVFNCRIDVRLTRKYYLLIYIITNKMMMILKYFQNAK